MSTSGAFGVVVALLAFSLAAAYWQIDRAQRRESMRDRIIREARETVHDVGPDALRLLQDLDAHLDDYAAQLGGLYERTGVAPALDPAWEAGRERLWDAIHDNQQKGDQQ